MHARADAENASAGPRQALDAGVTARPQTDLKRLIEISSNWFYWEQDEEFRFTLLSGSLFERAGIDTRIYNGKRRWEIGGTSSDDPQWDEHKKVLAAHLPFTEFVFHYIDARGEQRFVSTTGEPLFEPNGRFKGYRGISRDITQRIWIEKRRTIEHGVARILAESDLRSTAITEILRTLCEGLDWRCGIHWEIETDDTLRCRETWGTATPETTEFLAKTERLLITRADTASLVRRAITRGEAAWIGDIAAHETDPRSVWSRTAGLQSAFAFPITVNARVVGAVECFSSNAYAPDREMHKCAIYLGQSIGQYCERKQAEERLRESEARFRALTQLSSDWFWETDTQLRFTRLEGQPVVGEQVAGVKALHKKFSDIGLQLRDEHMRVKYRELIANRQPLQDLLMFQELEDGTRRYVSISGEPTYDPHGTFTGYRGIARDVTEQQRREEELSRFRAALDLTPEPIYLIDPITLRYIDFNETAWRATGYTREQLLKLGPTDLAPHVDPDQFRKGFAEAIANPDKAITVEYITEQPAGRAIIESQRRAVKIGDRWMIVSLVRNVTQRRLAERAMQRHQRMYAALSATNEAILRAVSPEELFQEVCDAAVNGGKFLITAALLPEAAHNRVRFAAVAGVGADKVREATYISLDESVPEGRGLVGTMFRTAAPCISNDYLKDERTRPWHAGAREGGIRAVAAVPILKNGTVIGGLLFHSKERNAFDEEAVGLAQRMADNIAFALENFERESERKRAEERIQYLATHDALTGLPNRMMFAQLLEHSIHSARRHDRKFAVLFIDLDRFKVINDTLGHEAGDRLLKEIARRLTETLRSSDVVARLGGDEFVLLIPEIDNAEQVITVARKVLSAIIRPLDVVGQECRVTGSIGISLYPDDAVDEQSLMKNADIAMYLAKQEGKNNFQFYSKEIKTQSLERLALEINLRHAIEREELSLHYQAKVDFKTAMITGVEALLRWQSAELGAISPAQFIPLAEETGMIVPIGKWVLRTACLQNVAWQRQGLAPICMAVNLSLRQFADDNLLQDIKEALAESGLSPQYLELEITEGMVMQNAERAIRMLTEIKNMGLRLAIDDFGTGYSSLAQLKRFPIDTLKVDRSFIREIPQDPEDKAITEAIIAMGKTLSLTVVAEGVETPEQAAFLREHACDEMQGYYFSKPITADEFAALLRDYAPNRLNIPMSA